MILKASVSTEVAGMRLDDGAKLLFPELSKTQIRRIIDWGGCTISDVLVRVASRQLKEGDLLSLGVMEPERCIEIAYRKEDLLFEDASYMAINKAAGINSQRTPYQLKGTAEYAVECYLKSLGSKEPARVIHRLDRGTSGVMFFPKDKRAATHISYMLKEGQVEKVYWALVGDVPDQDQWTVDAPIAKVNKFRYGVALPGRDARTDFRVILSGKGATLIEARPHTGRTHQIRVHLAHSGLPIIGDNTYDGDHALRMMLHCRSMAFTSREGKPICATAPVDAAFRTVCQGFGIDADQLAPEMPCLPDHV